MVEPDDDVVMPSPGSAPEVFVVFLKLGLASFGGPIAHLGYFRSELVERRRWLDDPEYADLVALCQFLPGPTSSQVGFGVGLHRAGARGALAAFLAFTLPSAIVLIGFAYGASLFTGPVGAGLLMGLKIVAVAVIGQAVLEMAKNLTPDKQRALIAVLAVVAALLIPGPLGQIAAIVLGAAAGVLFCRTSAAATGGVLRFPISRRAGIASLVVFLALLLGTPPLALGTGMVGTGMDRVALFDTFFRAGSLVFGGGHVMLPLLQAGVVDTGWVTDQQFLAGYGAAQAVPGPLFTFAAFLGVVSNVGPGGVLGASIALVAIFLPGFLLLVGVLPFWTALQEKPWAPALMRGANAAVVGILAAALYSPVFTTTITGVGAFSLAAICFMLLVGWKLPPWVAVAVGAAGGAVLSLTGIQ